jgi:hypothetical protein
MKREQFVETLSDRNSSCVENIPNSPTILCCYKLCQPNRGHVIGRDIFAPYLGNAAQMEDGQICFTGVLTVLVVFYLDI